MCMYVLASSQLKQIFCPKSFNMFDHIRYALFVFHIKNVVLYKNEKSPKLPGVFNVKSEVSSNKSLNP